MSIAVGCRMGVASGSHHFEGFPDMLKELDLSASVFIKAISVPKNHVSHKIGSENKKTVTG